MCYDFACCGFLFPIARLDAGRVPVSAADAGHCLGAADHRRGQPGQSDPLLAGELLIGLVHLPGLQPVPLVRVPGQTAWYLRLDFIHFGVFGPIFTDFGRF